MPSILMKIVAFYFQMKFFRLTGVYSRSVSEDPTTCTSTAGNPMRLQRLTSNTSNISAAKEAIYWAMSPYSIFLFFEHFHLSSSFSFKIYFIKKLKSSRFINKWCLQNYNFSTAISFIKTKNLILSNIWKWNQ